MRRGAAGGSLPTCPGLNADHDTYPPPQAGKGWTNGGVYSILSNPKYTGHMVFGRRRTKAGKRGRRVPPEQWVWSPNETHPAIVTRATWDAAQRISETHATSRDDLALSHHPQARRTYLLRGRIRCRPCKRRMYGITRPSSRYYSGGADVDHTYYLCPHDPANPAHQAQAPGHPATVSIREDLLLEHARQGFATRIFGPDRAALLREQLPASAAEQAAQRDKEAKQLRKKLKRIDTTEDAHIREVNALAGEDPNSPAVKAMRKRHLAAFAQLEAERDTINRKLTALAQQTTDDGGDPALLDALPLLGDVLPPLPDRIKAQLFDAFDLTMLYNKAGDQITCRATITPSTPAALAAIIAQAGIDDLAAYLNDQDHPSDLSRQPGPARWPRSGRNAGDAVANIGDRLDDGGLAELAAQPVDRDGDDVGERVGVLVPHLFEQVLGGQHGGLGAQQRLQDTELLDRQVKRPPIPDGGAPHGVEFQAGHAEHAGPGGRLATGQRLHPEHKLGEVEGLDQVVVGA